MMCEEANRQQRPIEELIVEYIEHSIETGMDNGTATHRACHCKTKRYHHPDARPSRRLQIINCSATTGNGAGAVRADNKRTDRRD